MQASSEAVVGAAASSTPWYRQASEALWSVAVVVMLAYLVRVHELPAWSLLSLLLLAPSPIAQRAEPQLLQVLSQLAAGHGQAVSALAVALQAFRAQQSQASAHPSSEPVVPAAP